MEIAIHILQNEIANRKNKINQENLMFYDRKLAECLLREIAILKQTVKLVKDHHQRKINQRYG